MSRKKIDKESINDLLNNLFYKEGFKGFQFTSGNTPLGVKENRPLNVKVSLRIENKSNVVIDVLESYLEKKIYEYIFPENYTLTKEKIEYLTEKFKELNYETENTDVGYYAGEWYWFRVYCNIDEVENHLKILKENLEL